MTNQSYFSRMIKKFKIYKLILIYMPIISLSQLKSFTLNKAGRPNEVATIRHLFKTKFFWHLYMWMTIIMLRFYSILQIIKFYRLTSQLIYIIITVIYIITDHPTKYWKWDHQLKNILDLTPSLVRWLTVKWSSASSNRTSCIEETQQETCSYAESICKQKDRVNIYSRL